MKNTVKYIIAFAAIAILGGCSNDENEVVPEFLDGTEYGVLLEVNVNSAVEVPEADLENYSLNFEVVVNGDKRPIESIVVSKTFVNGEDGETATVQQESLSEFPQSLSLTTANLVEGFTDLSVADLNAGDSFAINFTITYVDGRVVDRFDTSMRTNFKVLITE